MNATDNQPKGKKMNRNQIMAIKSVILDSNNEILGILNEDIGKEIVVAGAIALDGSPVNRKTYRASCSKANIDKARRSDAQFATRHEHRGVVFFTLNGE